MTHKELFRPVGLREVEKILDADARAFPPRLPDQPIFYPVLNRAYAEEIAEKWNAPRSAFVGFVTRFLIEEEYARRFPEKIVGGRQHCELWVPAEELEEFNRHIRGKITVVSAFYGPGYEGPTPKPTILKNRRSKEQLRILSDTFKHSTMDFSYELAVNERVVLLNFAYWKKLSASDQGLGEEQKEQTLDVIARAWSERHPDSPLPG